MADDSTSNLSLRDGASPTRGEWEEAVAGVLKKSGKFRDGDDPSSAPDRLTKKTSDGIAIVPLAGSDVATQLAQTTTGSDAVRGSRVEYVEGEDAAPAWDLRSYISSPDATSKAVLAELEGGATSLWVSRRDGAVGDLGSVLRGTLLNVAPVILDSVDPLGDLQTLAEIAGEQGLHADTNLGVDPIGEHLLTGVAPGIDLAAVATAAKDNGIRAFVIDASIVHDAGAGETLELGYAAAAGVALLRSLDDAGIAPVDAAGLIEFRYAATDQQFTTIAKLRAARAIWARVCQVLEVTDDVQSQHAVTSGRMMTQYDPWTNLLRTTIASFAAAAGGARAITVQPYDAALGESDDFGRRMARNISNLLVHESHIGQVTDPAGGSGSIESLTDSLARAGWQVFTEIEQAGGAASYVESGALNAAITSAVDARRAAIASRKQPITGISEFPLADEQRLDRDQGYSRYTAGALIQPVHDADAFEELRRSTAPSSVFLLPVGPIAAHTARATFAANLLAAGGIPIVSGTAGTDLAAIVDEAKQSGAKAICLVGSDDGYREQGAQIVAALRDAGIKHVIVAGKPVDEVADKIDDHMAVGADVLDFLHRTRKVLEG